MLRPPPWLAAALNLFAGMAEACPIKRPIPSTAAADAKPVLQIAMMRSIHCFSPNDSFSHLAFFRLTYVNIRNLLINVRDTTETLH